MLLLLLVIALFVITSSGDEPMPSRSPDATAESVASARPGLIAFTRKTGDTWASYTMQPDGSELRRINTGASPSLWDFEVAWSPDGEHLALSRNVGGSPEIWITDADGRGGRKLIDVAKAKDPWGEPKFSPDGTEIAYVATKNGNADIYVIGINGGDKRRVTDSRGRDTSPSWSPDGTRIVFQSDRGDSSSSNIYVIGVDGSGEKRLTQAAGFHPDWSPDGKSIVYAAGDDMYVMDQDGANKRGLSTGLPAVGNPSWSPDNEKITFDAGLEEKSDLYVIDADGSGLKRLTKNRWWDDGPEWQRMP